MSSDGTCNGLHFAFGARTFAAVSDRVAAPSDAGWPDCLAFQNLPGDEVAGSRSGRQVLSFVVLQPTRPALISRRSAIPMT